MIVADTIKGRGVRRMELSLNWHVGNLVGRDYDEVVAELQRGRPEAAASGEEAAMTSDQAPSEGQDQSELFRGVSGPADRARGATLRQGHAGRGACRPSCSARSWPTSPIATRASSC